MAVFRSSTNKKLASRKDADWSNFFKLTNQHRLVNSLVFSLFEDTIGNNMLLVAKRNKSDGRKLILIYVNFYINVTRLLSKSQPMLAVRLTVIFINIRSVLHNKHLIPFQTPYKIYSVINS